MDFKDKRIRSILIWVGLVLVIWFGWQFFSPKQTEDIKPKDLAYSEFVVAVKDGKIKFVEIYGVRLSGKFVDDSEFISYRDKRNDKTKKLLEKYNVEYKFKYDTDEGLGFFGQIFQTVLILALVLFGLMLLLRFMGKQQRKSFGGDPNIKAYNQKERAFKRVTFKDVAGVDEAKEEVQEVVDFLRDPKSFGSLGGRVPKGVLLVGPPGTGKTLLARAVAGEANVPFLYMSASEFMELFVGVGAGRARELFSRAKKQAPCIIFIDELDAIGRQRGAGFGGGHDEREQTLNQILVEMDGFDEDTGVIVLSATNRPDILDPALLRAGRFDREVVVDKPDINGRQAILKVHTRNKELADSVDLSVVARGTPGMTGADLENLCNEAALLAGKKKKSSIEMEDYAEALEKITMGKERRMIISDKEKEIIAIHESGHTIVNLLCRNCDPFHKVSIIPRGRGALGVTVSLPLEDRHLMSKSQINDYVLLLLGGRVAEEILLGEVSTGASNDLERATELIKQMVGKYGMDEEIGLASFRGEGTDPFLGRAMALHEGMSQQMQYKIEQRVCALLDEYHKKIKKMIEEKRDCVQAVADALLEHETLDAKQVKEIVGELN